MENQTTTEEKLSNRYTVGEKILLMRYNIQGSAQTLEHGLAVPRFIPWEDALSQGDQPIFLKTLLVARRHAVPGGWSDRPEYTGFVAQDINGSEWHNQYPRASYGQLDDKHDAVWTYGKLHEEHSAEKEAIYDGLSVRDYGQYEDVCRRLNHMHQSISPTSIFKIQNAGYRTALENHYTWLKKTIERMASVEIITRPIWEGRPDLVHHHVVWK